MAMLNNIVATGLLMKNAEMCKGDSSFLPSEALPYPDAPQFLLAIAVAVSRLATVPHFNLIGASVCTNLSNLGVRKTSGGRRIDAG